MKKLYLYITGIFIVLNLQAQTSPKDFIGLVVDSLGPERLELIENNVEKPQIAPMSFSASTPADQILTFIPKSYSRDITRPLVRFLIQWMWINPET